MKYIAYGSNMVEEQMAYRCPNATVLMPVVLSGYELTYRAGGVATVIPKKDSEVLGLMWSITPECEKSLDRYEGYPNFYHKTDVAVTDPETREETAPLTEAPAEENTVREEDPPKKGCASALAGVSALAMASAAALALRKRKED